VAAVSQHTYRTAAHTVVCGWDRPVQRHDPTVTRNDGDNSLVYANRQWITAQQIEERCWPS